MQHFGVDPRKHEKNTISESNHSVTTGNYNPYIKNSKSQKLSKPKNNSKANKSGNSISMTTKIERMNSMFDRFIQMLQDEPLHSSLEKVSKEIFTTQLVNCWNVIVNYGNFILNTKTVNNEDYENNTILYSASLAKSIDVKSKKSILTEFFKSHIEDNKTSIIEKYVYPPNDTSYNADYDYPFPTLLLPLFDSDSRLSHILQIVFNGKSNEPLNSETENLAELFSRKLTKYSHFFVVSNSMHILRSQSGRNGIQSVPHQNEQILISHVQHKLKSIFSCHSVEFWGMDAFKSCVVRYNENAGKFIPVGANCGVIRELFESSIDLINLSNVKESTFYSPECDGRNDESVMMAMLNNDAYNYAVIFRGKNNDERFSITDERTVRYFVPIIVGMFTECVKRRSKNQKEKMDENAIGSNLDSSRMLPDKSSDFEERLKALLEVAEIISGVLDIDILIPTIMERACSLLNTERCSLFLVDPVKQQLITRFHGGLNRSIRIPLKKGIVGHTAVTGQIVNIKDAYSDPRFDNHVDLATGFRTKTILTVPIYNNRGEIAGVTEMINKFDDGVFDEDDIRMLMTFNVFCGISLDNAKLYNGSLSLTRQLRSFVEMSNAMNNQKQIHSVLEQILGGAQDVINATRATLFMKERDELLPFVSIGDDLKYNTLFADEVMNDKNHQPYIFTREEIFIRVQSTSDKPIDGFTSTPLSMAIGKNNSATNSSSKELSRITSIIIRDDDDANTANNPDDAYSENICDIPLISSESKVIGILELSSSGRIMPEDLKLLDCFAVFAAVSIERSELQEIAKMGQTEVLIKKYLTMEERKSNDIPSQMKLDIDTDTLLSINFDAVAYDGVGHLKVLWAIADEYGILKEFNINNDKFFRFMVEISQTYKKVPYHNWRHAVDVSQFIAYEIKLTHLKEVLTKFELLGFFVSAVCHDANHDGFSNTFNEKAETPLGILYKNQSVMETHHCTVAITVMSKEECNLFSNLDSDQFKNMWNLIFQLILITDMAKHFDFLKSITADLDRDGKYDYSKPENRLKVMQLLLKCGDISNVSRPFELADKWCDVLCEEFFRQGDLEKANGMEYTSANNDREHLDKAKSQIGFYTFVCLPLYQLAARVFPELQVNVDQVQSNLAIWKAASEKSKKEDEDKKEDESNEKEDEEKDDQNGNADEQNQENEE